MTAEKVDFFQVTNWPFSSRVPEKQNQKLLIFFDRKLIIFLLPVRGDERVIRSCGWIEDERDRSASPQQQPPASWWWWSSSSSPSWPWSTSSFPGSATQQSWRSTTLMCALARANSATAPPRKSLIEKTWTADQLLHCRKSISVIAVLSTMALGYLIH